MVPDFQCFIIFPAPVAPRDYSDRAVDLVGCAGMLQPITNCEFQSVPVLIFRRLCVLQWAHSLGSSLVPSWGCPRKAVCSAGLALEQSPVQYSPLRLLNPALRFGGPAIQENTAFSLWWVEESSAYFLSFTLQGRGKIIFIYLLEHAAYFPVCRLPWT